MVEKFVAVMTLLCCFLVYKIYKFYYKFYMEKVLLKHVSWCVTDNSNIYRCNTSLLAWLCKVPYYSKKRHPDCFFPNADKLFLIEEKYWLKGDEEQDIAKEILQAYQKELSQKYFSEQLIANRLIFKLSDEEYFLLTLKNFLEKYECETTFLGNKMYNTKEYKSYGSWGAPLFDATYELTDYAVVYHKMYLIAQMYCLTLQKNPLDTSTLSFQSSEYTKKVLDTREIKVSRY